MMGNKQIPVLTMTIVFKLNIQTTSWIGIGRYFFTNCRAILWSTFTVLDKILNWISLQFVWDNSKIFKC